MAKYCNITGVELNAETPSLIKKMCLNCKSFIENVDGSYICTNETVMAKGREKILAAVPEGFEIDVLTLKPMALKNPTKKCGAYEANIDMIVDEIKQLFS